ncbi:hypothetical protein NE237_020258 [Protea cynaroides]|uniref:Secreted protein n=1 Tax=Protea cynaroides TaxID=273540 RepID=A0A9Q0K3P9_9MAGN|nr:hypothetical protein NE237_020258 [Protea cynaroides]
MFLGFCFCHFALELLAFPLHLPFCPAGVGASGLLNTVVGACETESVTLLDNSCINGSAIFQNSLMEELETNVALFCFLVKKCCTWDGLKSSKWSKFRFCPNTNVKELDVEKFITH